MTYEIKQYGCMTPYDFQGDVIGNVLEHVRKQFQGFEDKRTIDHAFVNASVSSGKSLMMGAVAEHCTNVGINSMILTAIGELALQDGETLWDMKVPCSYYSNYVGRKSTHYPVISATVGSVVNALDKDFADYKLHVLQIDECHLVGFDNEDSDFMKVINHFKSINPLLVVIGYTGTPWRKGCSIKGEFWKEEILPVVDRQFLTENGFTVPDVFGFTDHEYDLGSEFSVSSNECSMTDFSDSQLDKMHSKMKPSMTDEIMKDVVEMTKDRNGVLVTCAGLTHCKEAAEGLSGYTWAIVTSKDGVITNTDFKTRKDVVHAFKEGKVKFLINIGIFLTGFNAPIVDCIVILRRIGSIVLFEQLLGRGRRLLKPNQIESGIIKNESLVLDFSGTVESMYEQYSNPTLEEAMKAKDSQSGEDKVCPDCGTLNGEHARRCGNVVNGDRCEHFFMYRECDDLKRGGIIISKGCGAQNDIAARDCRICGNVLIDPNAKLARKHYSNQDWKPVLKMEFEVIGNNQEGVQVNYYLDSYGEDGQQEIAHVKYWAIQGGGKRTWTSNFVRRHINGYQWQQRAINMQPIAVLQSKAMFDCPVEVTHRINDKGQSVVHGLRFSSGKEMKGSKHVSN